MSVVLLLTSMSAEKKFYDDLVQQLLRARSGVFIAKINLLKAEETADKAARVNLIKISLGNMPLVIRDIDEIKSQLTDVVTDEQATPQ